MMNNRLTLKVKAVNFANQYAKVLFYQLSPYFSQFVGQKIEKVDGTLLKKIADNLPNINQADGRPDGLHVSFMTYRNNSRYTLSYVAKVCVSGSDGCAYHEATAYIGNLEDGVLKDCKFGEPSYRTDWTPEEVTHGRGLVEKARRELSEAESAIREFGQYNQ